MSHLTKDQLRDALVANGQPAPPASARKEELISLYRATVSPVRGRDGETLFSDDEGTPGSPGKKRRAVSAAGGAGGRSPSPRKSASVSNFSFKKSPSKRAAAAAAANASEDVEAMEDDELYRRLKEYGVDVGPVVGESLQIVLLLVKIT